MGSRRRLSSRFCRERSKYSVGEAQGVEGRGDVEKRQTADGREETGRPSATHTEMVPKDGHQMAERRAARSDGSAAVATRRGMHNGCR